MMCYTFSFFGVGGLCSLSRLALLKRYWLVFFRAPWSGTARCRPGRWMVRSGLWQWAFMHYVGYSSMFVGGVDACDVTAALCSDHRTYCNTEEKHEHRHLTQIQAIKLFMTSRRPNLKCENPFTPASMKAGFWDLKGDDLLQKKAALIFESVMSCRWQRADPGGVIWCGGHCSTGGLLDRADPQQVGVWKYVVFDQSVPLLKL